MSWILWTSISVSQNSGHYRFLLLSQFLWKIFTAVAHRGQSRAPQGGFQVVAPFVFALHYGWSRALPASLVRSHTQYAPLLAPCKTRPHLILLSKKMLGLDRPVAGLRVVAALRCRALIVFFKKAWQKSYLQSTSSSTPCRGAATAKTDASTSLRIKLRPGKPVENKPWFSSWQIATCVIFFTHWKICFL